MPTLHISNDLKTLIRGLIQEELTIYNTNLHTYDLWNVSHENVSDCNNMLTNGCYFWIPNTSNRPPENYGTIFTTVSFELTGNNRDNWVNQIAFGTNGKIYFRQKINADAWTHWVTLH